MSVEESLTYARTNRARFLEELKEFLAIPSISTLPDHKRNMEQAAGWLRDRLQAVGVEAEIIQGDGHSLVYGEWLGAPGAPTILLYGHYDVQPVDPIELWTTPPFEASIRNGNIYARGACDDKGQVMTLVHAAESIMRSEGRLPINLKFLFEGEEECGGAVIKEYVAREGERLKADVVQVADTGMYGPNVPTLETGLRGIIYTEVHAKGASHDLHSGLYGGVAPNPLNALAWVLADLKGTDGRINIPHFYDDVQMPPEDILESWRRLPFDEQAYRTEAGVTELVGEPGFTPLEQRWARPTLDIHGISGGFTGVGAKTVIPSEATAKVSMRLVPNQRAARAFELFKQRVLELSPAGIRLDVRLIHGDDPVVVEMDSPFIRLASHSLEETFGSPVVLARSGGSIPIVGVFKELLQVESILMGWALPDDGPHAPDEKFSIESLNKGTEATIRFWNNVGTPGSHPRE